MFLKQSEIYFIHIINFVEVTQDHFNQIDNCAIINRNSNDEPTIPVLNSIDGDNKTRKRRLSKTVEYFPPLIGHTISHGDQVQQTSEKRTCVVASSTDIGLTTTKSTHEFDMTQECLHYKNLGNGANTDNANQQTSSPSIDNCKTLRLEVSENVKMEEIIKSEVKL